MQLIVNGKETKIKNDVTLEVLLEDFQITPATRGIAVAVNDTVVPREAWGKTALREGDAVEIIRAVQGG